MTDPSKRPQDAAVALALAAAIVACPALQLRNTYNLTGIPDQMKKGPDASD